jgi:hypothetical protein
LIISSNRLPLSDAEISPGLSLLAAENKLTHLKIIHRQDFTPLAYAVGFGNIHDASLIVGGTSDTDRLSPQLLLLLSKILSQALKSGDSLMSINITRLFELKGVWIIPSFCSCDKTASAMNFISEKLSPKRLLELHFGEERILYCTPKARASNARLFAYLLSSSSGFEAGKELTEENSLCRWFSNQFSKISFSMGIGEEHTALPLLNSLLEAFLIFIAA